MARPYLYDDNFGYYKIESNEDIEEVVNFYKDNQRKSVLKKCVDCGRMVRIRRDYECCNSCADRRERGGF